MAPHSSPGHRDLGRKTCTLFSEYYNQRDWKGRTPGHREAKAAEDWVKGLRLGRKPVLTLA